MQLLFVHGWGFDAGFWAPVIAHLPDADCVLAERGYFGAPVWPRVDGPCLAITHSFGAMALLAEPPAQCRGLIAINGFDRFCEGDGRPGVPRRVVDRMLARLDRDPAAVLAEFRKRIGAGDAVDDPVTPRLAADLVAMRDGDMRDATARLDRPVLAVDGAGDPLLPEAMRAAQFDGAARLTRETLDGGHLLPLTHPQLCAAMIDRFKAAA